MAYYLAVANRKGGVGKSTMSTMLAYSFAVWGGKKVLLVDLDTQCNASFILVGGSGWNDARKAHKTIGNYFFDRFDHEVTADPQDYLIHGAGDVLMSNGRRPALSLLPGDVLLEDVQGELFIKEAKGGDAPDAVGGRVRSKLIRLLKPFAKNFDVVIFDCAPGLSFAALAALELANKVVVPFRPDFISQFAVDRVAMLIQSVRDLDDLAEIPMDKRRYVCVANYVRDRGNDRLLIEEIESLHPVLGAYIPHHDGIADAFDWTPQPQVLEKKYGAALGDVRRLYEELLPLTRT
jgi:chromosome partitioning protein